MNRDSFFTYLGNNNELPSESIAYLQEIKDKYPYFQTGQVLHTKALFANKDNDFEEELRKAAIRVHDRKHLYEFIHFLPDDYFAPIIEEKEKAQPIKQVLKEEQQSPTANRNEKSVEEEVLDKKIKQDLEIKETPEQKEDLRKEKDNLTPKEKPKADKKPISAQSANEEILDKKRKQGAAAKEKKENSEQEENLGKENLTQKERPKTDKNFIPIQLTNEEILDKKRKDVADAAKEKKEIPEQKEESMTKQPDKLEQQYLSEAIGAGYLENLDKEENKKVADKEQTSQQTEPSSFSGWVNFFNEAGKKENKTSKSISNIQELIDKVRTSKKDITERASFYSAEKMAKKSAQINDDIITETLANIYYQQESYEKALEAYKKLSLKFPKKRAYFANQIKLIKNKLS